MIMLTLLTEMRVFDMYCTLVLGTVHILNSKFRE